MSLPATCPKCRKPFEPFLRYQIQQSTWKFWTRAFWRPGTCLICWACKEVVGYER